ncbi:MAG: hypothetical protein ACYS19_01325 [Planctomycetota bacterium]|jgi:hypothetical protein
MRITHLKSTVENGRARVSATVSWEDCDWSERELYFATDVRFADSLTQTPNAFLLAAIIPAMHFGERRVQVEGRICPQLRNGLVTAMQQLRDWYGHSNNPVDIEATQGFMPSHPLSAPRTASCMSGGIDSLCTFRQNRIDFPLSHSGAIKDLIFIHGVDMGGHEAWEDNLQNFQRTVLMMKQMAQAAGATLIPLYTNMRSLEEDVPELYYSELSLYEWFGAQLAALAHALSRRITTLLIPSSHSVDDLEPIGSHPLLDPNYSSSSIVVRHDGLWFSRLEKTRLVSEWEAGLQVLRVCADPVRPPDVINCGKCEKCLRTMATLLVLGKLDQCMTFPIHDVKPSDIQSLGWTIETTEGSKWAYLSESSARFWGQLVEPLRKINRQDLADAIINKLEEYRRLRARLRWKNRIRWVDQKFLWSTMSRVRRAIRHRLA